MSSPARQVRARQAAKPRARTSPSPRPLPKKPVPPRKPAEKKPAEKPSRSPARRAERRTGLFYAFAIALLLVMVFGLASINAVLAQGAFRLHALTQQEAALASANGQLRREIDDLSSPARLTAAAAKAGLVFPDTNSIQVVHAGKALPNSGGKHANKNATSNKSALPGQSAGTRSQPATTLPGGPE